MTLKLNQVIAIEKGAKASSKASVDNIYKQIQKAEPFQGIIRQYAPLNDEGDQLPGESKHVQVKVTQLIETLSTDWTRLLDITATKDNGNTLARADVVIDGTTVVANVPVTTLLFLEKQLVDLHTFVGKLPALDPADVWELDTTTDSYKSVPTQGVKTKKVPKAFVKAEATDKHPAQVEMFQEDVIQGTWTTTKLSGAIPAARQNEMLRRVEELQAAVKIAREEANTKEVPDVKIGESIFDYVFNL